MMKGVSILVLIFSLQLIDMCNGSVHKWLPDTNFENPANWNAKRTPCGNDVVLIPDESPVIYMQLNSTVQELVLPRSGEVILGPNVNIGFTQNTDPKCSGFNGDVVEFTAVHPKSWLDPSNWCEASSGQGSCDMNTPTLDAQRVPCSFNDVILPRHHSYYVDLSEPVKGLTVKSLRIAGSSFTTSSFSSYLRSEDGHRMFKTSSQQAASDKVKITRKPCDDRRGCACGNDKSQILKSICSHVVKTCGRPRCKNTVQPLGACCRMCGAVFNITRGYGYDHAAFKNLIYNNFYKDDVRKDVNMTLLVTSQGWIQLALNDQTGEKSAALAKSIKTDMDADLSNGGHKYAIDEVNLMLSMGSALGPSAHTDTESMGAGSVAGIVIGLIVILAVLVLMTICLVFKRTGRDIPKMPTLPSVSMPTLPRLPRRMPRATARVPAQPKTASHIDPGFANPLYDTSPFDNGRADVKEMELMSTGLEQQPTFDMSAGGGFNNPLYSTQGAMFDDPARLNEPESKPQEEDTTGGLEAATGAAKQTADIPSADTSAKMVLVNLNDDTDNSTI